MFYQNLDDPTIVYVFTFINGTSIAGIVTNYTRSTTGDLWMISIITIEFDRVSPENLIVNRRRLQIPWHSVLYMEEKLNEEFWLDGATHIHDPFK